MHVWLVARVLKAYTLRIRESTQVLYAFSFCCHHEPGADALSSDANYGVSFNSLAGLVGQHFKKVVVVHTVNIITRAVEVDNQVCDILHISKGVGFYIFCKLARGCGRDWFGCR